MNEIEIYSLAYGGSGVGKLDGKVCFVEGALPGETVEFIREKEKKRFISGRAGRVVKASEERVEPICPYYGKCGGCQYQHLRYDKEPDYKAQQVKDLLRTIGGIEEFEFEGIVPSSSAYGYRYSVTLHRSPRGYGYFAKDNRTVIPVERCPLAADQINEVIASRENFRQKDVTIKCNTAGRVYNSEKDAEGFYKSEFFGTPLNFSPLAFSQVNHAAAEAMAEKFRAWSGQEKAEVLFDVYCGVGFFGILARDSFSTVIGIDSSRPAVKCASQTKKELKLKDAAFFRADAAVEFASLYRRFSGRSNLILVDPPRSGLSQNMAGTLSQITGASRLIYVSCDPATLARDAKLLGGKGGWQFERAVCFDMFARTKHIETMALFRNTRG